MVADLGRDGDTDVAVTLFGDGLQHICQGCEILRRGAQHLERRSA